MAGRFWFGHNLPTEFQDSAVRDLLSFNGQLHFRCRSCNEITWADITFGTHCIKTGTRLPCPNCRQDQLSPVKFIAIASRLCAACGTQSFAPLESAFSCPACGGKK